ncbi:hypothetical protein [Variovorax sp. Root473]|jgi:hypothetical protein|uniref:hypothetical protein n=1 Tax=Variovorax sp. Root473 TaxID=1736541 RepID=UPI0006F6DDEF|nr:hypothetical protein [Variovorax sp. Root473]KQX96049.1 hypothetical protein ASD34_01730 [Variovorax sp. Root473]
MVLLLPLLLMVVLVAVVLFGGYLLRAVLPAEHALQARLTDEAISRYVDVVAKNAKGILACLLILYFTVVTFLYS